MVTFVFRCPNSGVNVQGWLADDTSDEPDTYDTIVCTACGQLHFVNPAKGKVLGEQDRSA